MMGMTGGPDSPPVPIDVGRNALLPREPDCHLPAALIRKPAGALIARTVIAYWLHGDRLTLESVQKCRPSRAR